jgi:hypothetical protein
MAIMSFIRALDATSRRLRNGLEKLVMWFKDKIASLRSRFSTTKGEEVFHTKPLITEELVHFRLHPEPLQQNGESHSARLRRYDNMLVGASPPDNSPWTFERKPNPVIFGHVYPTNPPVIDSRWRHIPIDTRHLSWEDEAEEVLHDKTERGGMSLEKDVNASILDIEMLRTTPETCSKEDATCSYCDASFPTLGKLKSVSFYLFALEYTKSLSQHINLKHIRRFKCDVCPSAFFLKTDLTRHALNVHSTHTAVAKAWTCPNQGCNMHGKPFFRKDNFERHVKRCRA